MAKYDDVDWIPELNPADPPGTEDIALGDNLLRAITRVLQNHFPGALAGDAYTGTLSALNSLAAGTTLPRDTVIMWGGDQVTFPDGPDGWTICDGRARKDGLGGTAPDLRSRFIAGAQPASGVNPLVPYVGVRGGNSEVDIRKSDGTLVEFTSEEHVLTGDEIAAHTHAMFTSENTSGDSALGADDLVAYFGDLVGADRKYKMQPSNLASATLGRTGSAGTGAALGHSHKFTIDGSATFTGANNPLYHALLFIIKD